MSLPELATRRRVTVGMLTLTMVLFGLIGLAGLKVNLLPDLSYPTLTVRTEYEGAAPLEIAVARCNEPCGVISGNSAESAGLSNAPAMPSTKAAI